MKENSRTDTIRKRAKTGSVRRRILAATCAFAIALLQCAVILTVETEDVHAETSVKVEAKAKGVKTKEKNYEIVDTTINIEVQDPDDPTGPSKTKSLNGAKVSAIKGKVGLSEGETGLDDNAVLVKNGDKYDVYEKNGDTWKQTGSVDKVTIDMPEDFTPSVKSITISPGSLSLNKGESKDLKATVKFNQSIFDSVDDSDVKKLVNLSWTVTKGTGNATITPSSDKMSAKIKVDKAGTYTVNVVDTISNKKTSIKDDGKKAAPKDPPAKEPKKTPKEDSPKEVEVTNNKYTTHATAGAGSYRPANRVSGGNNSNSTTTGTTVPNVTYAPDRTITVKEVFLGAKMDEPQQQDPYSSDPYNTIDVEPDDWNDGFDDWNEDPSTTLDFGPMAGSAAVAVAACGAGAVGRVRRFKGDTAAAIKTAVGDRSGKLFGKKN